MSDVARIIRDTANKFQMRLNDREEQLLAAAILASVTSQGEAVAWLYDVVDHVTGEVSRHFSVEKPAGNSYQRNIKPLYAAPPVQTPAQVSGNENGRVVVARNIDDLEKIINSEDTTRNIQILPDGSIVEYDAPQGDSGTKESEG